MVLLNIFVNLAGFLFFVLSALYWYLEALFRQFIPPPLQSIDGESILVTGAVGGIGSEICKNLILSGSHFKLVLLDINEKQLSKFSSELEGLGKEKNIKIFHFPVDLSTRENIEACSRKVGEAVGPISIIFNNAGLAPTGNLLQMSSDEIEKTLQVNLLSQIWIIRQFLPDMLSRNKGRIVNMCSMSGLMALPNALPYFASKFGVNGATEALKMELALFNYDGIHVSTTLFPYFVKTPMLKSLEWKNREFQFPLKFLNFLEPDYVGRKAVEGMRREYECIYLPAVIPLICWADYLIPTKLRKYLQSIYFSKLEYRDAGEELRSKMGYDVVYQNKNGN